MSERHVVVLGGGLAGITAALDCVDAGARVSLLEVRPRLGGAAYSFERDGLWLDNGQHVFLRCCSAYRELLERLGSTGRVRIQPRLEIPVLSPGLEQVFLRRSGLPAPLHMAGALARYPHLSRRQRLRAARAALALTRLDSHDALEWERLAGNGPGLFSSAEDHATLGNKAVRNQDGVALEESPAQGTLGAWLAEHGQDSVTVAALWDLIALPSLNLPAAQGSLALGAFVLRTGLFERNDAGDIGFHVRPLSETLGAPAERLLGKAGVDLQLGVRAKRIERCSEGSQTHSDGRQCLRVRTDHGELDADAVICALPHTRAASLLEPLLGAETKPWTGLGQSPIINVHVVYDRRVCELSFAAGVGTPVQYLFDRTAAAGLSDGQCLAVSLSGATNEMELSNQALRERYVDAMRELFPKARDAVVRSVHVSREHAATFAARPGTGVLRPGARTSVQGLVLAGAWTDTGWPATLEGAVLSGHSAARAALCP